MVGGLLFWVVWFVVGLFLVVVVDYGVVWGDGGGDYLWGWCYLVGIIRCDGVG